MDFIYDFVNYIEKHSDRFRSEIRDLKEDFS